MAAFVILLLAACSKTDPRSGPAPSPSSGPSTTPIVVSVAAPNAGTSAVVDAAPAAAPAPARVATLVVQRVSADCGVGGGGGWAGTEEKVHYLGTDLFVLLQSETPGEKPKKEFVFCPSELPDGGAQKVQLSLWQYCRAFPTCRIVSPEAGSESRVEVQCGKETIVLESDGTRTFLRGSFGERVIAPGASRIAPPKTEVRMAMVDC